MASESQYGTRVKTLYQHATGGPVQLGRPDAYVNISINQLRGCRTKRHDAIAKPVAIQNLMNGPQANGHSPSTNLSRLNGALQAIENET